MTSPRSWSYLNEHSNSIMSLERMNSKAMNSGKNYTQRSLREFIYYYFL
jgi:hypothetical protein